MANEYTKYPRTYHLPWSPGATSDDKFLSTLDHFIGKQVVVTEKLDGENTSLYCDHLHARSLDSKHHPSRTWIKRLHGEICGNIPFGWRICGENVYAKHSIFYNKLKSYFYAFSIWECQICKSWDETKEWAALLEVELAPVLYEGIWDETAIKNCWTGESKVGGEQEGYVVRLKSGFVYEDFATSLAKFVRKNHVQTSEHWLSEELVPNLLEG